MIEFTAGDFDELCRDSEVRTQLGAHEERRRKGLRHFWLYLLGASLLAILILLSLIGNGWPVAGFIVAAAVLIVGLIIATRPLGHAKTELKHPVLERLAARGGMEYIPDGFDPPVFPDASRPLFGGISGYKFTDLFHGIDPEGRKYALYEGHLSRGSGKNRQTVFSGQFYAFQRRSRSGGQTVVVPDKGIFNFLKPNGLDRVRFEGDAEFEKKFEVYTSEPSSTLALLDADARRRLVQLRSLGRVFAYVGPEDVLVGVWGHDRFEPGNMFSSRPAEARARLMFDEVCAALSVMRTLKAVLD
jgi:hypothetical protein